MSRNRSSPSRRAAGAVVAAAAAWAAASSAVEPAAAPAVRRIVAPPAVRVLVPAARFKFEVREAVGFDLDAATLGALSIADITARLGTQPAGVALPFDGSGGNTLTVHFSAEARRLSVRLAGGAELASIEADPPGRPLRLCLRQRDQAALFVVQPAGGPAPLVWSGRVDYRLLLPEADQYTLCRNLRATMGSRVLKPSDVREGILLDSLDEVAPVRVEGVSPTGAPFVHEIPIEPKAVEDRVDRAMADLVRMLQTGGTMPGEGARANP